MHAKLDSVYLMLLTALGLPLGCATDPNLQSSGDTSTSTASSGSESGNETGDSNGTETGDGDGDPPPDPFECANPQPVLQDTGNPSGWVECNNGFMHRAEAVTCETPFGADTCGGCTDCENGTCRVPFDEFGCECVPGCATDADCPANNVCVCAGVIPNQPSQCVPAGCAVDGDCGEGGLCGLSISLDTSGCGSRYRVGCAGPDDCHSIDECELAPCPDSMVPLQWECLYTGNGFECAPPDECGGVCGRPFFVDGEIRVASTRARADWCSRIEPRDLEALDPDTRRELAAYWTNIGQLEHASIASFARFAMQLQQLGAPPRLLLDTHAAMADEVRHAERAFGLASAYAGTPVGPGPLDVRAAISSTTDLYEIVDGLIVEACVGETLSALEAVEAAAQVEDPAVAATLERIAEDELRHAALGWRSLRWLLDRGDARLQAFALARLEAALAELEQAPAAEGLDVGLRRFGVVDDALRREVRAQGIAGLLRPCVAALRRSCGMSEDEVRVG